MALEQHRGSLAATEDAADALAGEEATHYLLAIRVRALLMQELPPSLCRRGRQTSTAAADTTWRSMVRRAGETPQATASYQAMRVPTPDALDLCGGHVLEVHIRPATFQE